MTEFSGDDLTKNPYWPRGSGRTYRMIQSLPEEGAFVVARSHAIGRHIQQQAADIRGPEYARKLRILSTSSPGDHLKVRGTRLRVVFDHHVFDTAQPESEWAETHALLSMRDIQEMRYFRSCA